MIDCPWCSGICHCHDPKPTPPAEQTLADCQPVTRVKSTSWLIDLPGCTSHDTAEIGWWNSTGRTDEWAIHATRRQPSIVQAGGRRGMQQRHQRDRWTDGDPNMPTWAADLLAATKMEVGQ